MKSTNSTFEQLEFKEGCYINTVIQKDQGAFPLHWHTAAEIIMPTEGSYQVIVNNKHYFLNTHDILFISIGELHEFPIETLCTHMIVQFDFSLISSLKDFNSALSILQSVKLVTKGTAPDIHEDLVRLLHDICVENESSNEFKNAFMYSKLLEIYVHLARKHTNLSNLFPELTINKQREYTDKFALIFSYINQHFMNDLTLDDLANQAGFSKFHFSRLFKQFTGQTLYDYINQKRISSAEVLLLNPHLSITEVSLQSGFNSLSTFNRVFKSLKNCTPSEFKSLYISH